MCTGKVEGALLKEPLMMTQHRCSHSVWVAQRLQQSIQQRYLCSMRTVVCGKLMFAWKPEDALLTKPLYVDSTSLLPLCLCGVEPAAVHTAALPVSGQTVSSWPGVPSCMTP